MTPSTFRAALGDVDLLEQIRTELSNSGATVAQVFKRLAATRVFPSETFLSVSPLCVIGGAIRKEFAGLLSTDPRPLVLSVASALVLLACISWPEVSQITLKTPNKEAIERKVS
jgi:hypothetical protein